MTLRMPMMRTVLLALLLGLAVSGEWSATKAQSAFSLTPVGPDLYFYYTDGASNSTVLITEEGVLIVDSQGNRRAAEALLTEIRKKTADPIKWVVNGQDHGDHYLGNAVFKREGATIVAEAETARIIDALEGIERELTRIRRALE